MKDQFCTYEIAVKLKELGFNDPCLGEWQNLKTGYNLVINEEDRIFNAPILGAETTAPLWQQAIDWLREKHGLIVEIQYANGTFYGHMPITSKLQWPKDSVGNKNYNKAREAAILKALELIK